MAQDIVPFSSTGFAPLSDAPDLNASALPIFLIEKVQLQFEVQRFAAVQVANNVIILASETNTLLRIDLANPQDVDDIELSPSKKSNELGSIRKIFLDPTASHLLITTTLGENFYLHSRSTKVRPLSRLKNVHIESVAWSPAQPSTSTREILIGTRDGTVYETFIEFSDQFMARDEKYVKLVYRLPDGQPITGLHIDGLPGKPDLRRVVLTTPNKLIHFVGRIQKHGHSDTGPIFSRFFDSESSPMQQDFREESPFSTLAISPEDTDEYSSDNAFAWLSGAGVYHGKLLISPPTSDLGIQVFSESKLFTRSALPEDAGEITSILLTHFHLIVLCGNVVYAINRYNESLVLQEKIEESPNNILGLVCDPKKSTYWVFSTTSIYEIIATEEDRDVWKIMLANSSFEGAQRYAKTPQQRDAVAVQHGEYLVSKGQTLEAASIWGKSSKSFEEVSLKFLELGDSDALRRYLLTKLSTLKKTSIMQRMICASWLVEVFMSKLNVLDDMISAKAVLASGSEVQLNSQLSTVRAEFQDFVTKNKADLDKKTSYEIIGSHGRQEELLFYASAINDYQFVLSYWVQREKWAEALDVLKRQQDPEIFYKTSSVLMSNAPMETVDILVRQSNLNPRNLIPALLNYNRDAKVPLAQNQAVRYLSYMIGKQEKLGVTDSAVHNTLISIYASHYSHDETALLKYLESHSAGQHYDADFALRLCILHGHVKSCVHIFSSMGQFDQAVEMALQHGDVELASIVANRPEEDPVLRKKLWLSVAKAVISKSEGIKPALEFLKQCELIKIEDLIPFFPDFVVIDDFKEEICTALEDYSHHIELLKKEMDESTKTTENIRADISSLDRRYAIVEPGEHCHACQYPLLSRQFFVFPCQHVFHSDCLTNRILKQAAPGKARRIRDLQREIGMGIQMGKQRERLVEELDGLIAGSCILCSELAVRWIDEPFLKPEDDLDAWAI